MPENLILKSLIDAARILDTAATAVCREPLPVFALLTHALSYINAQLNAEMRGAQ